jgi:hypothetical protein
MNRNVMRSLNSRYLSKTRRNHFCLRKMRMKMKRTRHLNRTAFFHVTTEWKKLATSLYHE